MSEAPLILTIDEATMPPVHDSAVVIVRDLFFNVSTRALSRNNADQMVFQTEKALGEFGDKVSAEEKSEVETKLSALKEALKSGSVDDIKAKQDDLQKAFYAISEKVYQQAAQAQGQQPGAQPGPDAGAQPKDDGAVDADFHEV